MTPLDRRDNSHFRSSVSERHQRYALSASTISRN